MISAKNIKIILQGLLLSVIAIVPFIQINTLYFPFVSGKVYGFRLLVCLAFFFWVWLMFKTPKPKPPASPAGRQNPNFIFILKENILPVALVFFFLAQCFVSFFGVNPALSFFSTIERQDGVIQYGFWVLYFLMLVFAFRSEKSWKILISVFIATAAILSGYAWINFVSQYRLEALFGNPSYLAAYLLFAIGFCVIAIERIFFKNKFINILLWVLTLFFAATIFFTQTRGVYLGLAGAVFLFCILSVLFLRGKNKKLVVVCATLLAIGILSVAGLFFAKDTKFVQERPLLARMTEVTKFWEVGSIRERVLTWEIALKAFADKPIFGYGPENFMVAFNKYYDFRIGSGDAWFDHAHNQFLEYLATGGSILFSFWIFLLASVFYVILKIYKNAKILSFILGGIFLSYIVQGVFLFDTLPIYLGLFPFLAFVVYANRPNDAEKLSFSENKWQKLIFIASAFFCIFGIYTTVFLPYVASTAAIQFMAGTQQGYYEQAIPFIKKAFEVNSPYTYWEIRKRAGWQFLATIDGDAKLTDQQAKDLGDVYDSVVPELERFVKKMPIDPQIYYVLPRIYRLGSEKLGKNDLEKSRLLLEKSFAYSNTRVEYYNEMALDLLTEGKFSEGEKLLKDYVDRMKPISFDYFSPWLMGNYYYVAGKYDLAAQDFLKAKDAGYDFTQNDGIYSRYIDVSDKTKNYQEIVDMSLKYIEYREQHEPLNADVYFNTALGYYYLGQKEKSKEFFSKALELNKEQYQQYSSFFGL